MNARNSVAVVLGSNSSFCPARCCENGARVKALSQQALAETLESNQSRVFEMETADPTVSLDWLIRSLLHPGVTSAELGERLAKT